MEARRLRLGITSLTLLTFGAAWFASSVAMVLGDWHPMPHGWVRHFHAVGISLPWAALLASTLVDEDYPREARLLARICLTVAALLTAAALVHHLWLDPELGRAFLLRKWPPLRRALGGLGLHETLLAVHGPLLSLASWYWLRSLSGAPDAPPPRLAGSRVAAPGGPARG